MVGSAGHAPRRRVGRPRALTSIVGTVAVHLTRNLAAVLAVAAILLIIFNGSGHRLHVLPADASTGPVLFAATLLGAGITVVERWARRLLH